MLYWKDMRFAMMLRNNFRRDNLGAIQLDWSITPSTLGKLLMGGLVTQDWIDKYLSDKFSLYVQYFNGYGEGLMDYNKSINRISVGFMIAEWN
jgi:phospholipase A1